MASNNFLSISEYDIAVKNLDKFARNQKLKNAKPFKSQGITQIYGISGGYSRVYKITIDNKPKALRCWFKNPGKVQKRYPIIARYLADNLLSYFVDFQYVPDAIYYGSSISVSWMDWVDGDTLSKFLDKNIKNQKLLLHIANEFLSMIKALHKLNIAHGDLQSENIMVCANGNQPVLKLIDYDSLYVPSLPDNALDELPGVSSFQHPKRPKIMREKADYFSELVIFLSLIVYSHDPSYWNGSAHNDKKLLFEDTDFLHPDISKLFSKLSQSTDPKIAHLAGKLKEYSKSDPTKLIPLEEVLSLSSTSASIKTSESLDAFFDSIPSTKPISNSSNSSKSNFDEFFERPSKVEAKINPAPVSGSKTTSNILECPKGHKAPNPQAIFCPICNDTASFFGPSRACPHCRKTIPNRNDVTHCLYCGKYL